MNVDTKKLIFIGPMDFPPGFNLEKQLSDHPENMYIVIDGGLNHFPNKLKQKNSKIFLIGDGDSITKTEKIAFTQKLPTEKDLSDLQAGVNYITHLIKTDQLSSIEELHFYGFSDKRVDHYLYNIGVISRLTSLKYKIFQYTQDGILQYIAPGIHYFNHHGLFSILNLSKTELSIQGEVKYPLLDFKVEQILDNRLLSNISQGNFSVKINQPIIIYLNIEGTDGK